MSNLSLSQQKAIAIVPKISSFLSLFGSLWIICEILYNRSSKLKKVYHRIILMMSILDMILSVACFLSSWPMPHETEGVWGAMGSSRTCTAQGFLMHLGVGTGFYSAGLAAYYVLIIRYHMKDAVLQQYFEPCLHLFSILLPLGTAIASVFMDLFRPSMTWCRLVSTDSSYCDGNNNEDPTTCSRQRRAQLFGLLFSIVPMCICVILVFVSMVVVYWTVRKIENRTVKYHHRAFTSSQPCDTIGNSIHDNNTKTTTTNDKNNNSSSSSDNNLDNTCHSVENIDNTTRSNISISIRTNIIIRQKRRRRDSQQQNQNQQNQQRKSRQVAYQAMYHIAAGILTVFFPAISSTIFIHRANEFDILLPKTFFFPLLGFFNMIIYKRPKYLQLKRNDPLVPWWKIIMQCFFVCNNSSGGSSGKNDQHHHNDQIQRRRQQQQQQQRQQQESQSLSQQRQRQLSELHQHQQEQQQKEMTILEDTVSDIDDDIDDDIIDDIESNNDSHHGEDAFVDNDIDDDIDGNHFQNYHQEQNLDCFEDEINEEDKKNDDDSV